MTNTDEASSRAGGLVFTAHRPGLVNTDIMYLPPGATTAVALTNDDFTNRHPALSPDGTLVAFESDRSGQFDIWVIGVAGTGLRRVTDHPADDTWPTWSPLGDRIAFSSTRDDPAGDIYVVPAAGGLARRLTNDPAADTQPDWSSTGSIAFTRTVAGKPPGIVTMADTGGTVTNLVPGDQPAWSPDGTRIAYVDRSTDPSGDIKLVVPNTRAVTPVAADPARAQSHPTWAASLIIFTDTTPDESSDVWSSDATGADRRDLTDAPDTLEEAPAYSPDGNRLAYVELRQTHGEGIPAAHIMVADADGRNTSELTPMVDGVLDLDPAWSPDGSMIAFSRQNADTPAMSALSLSYYGGSATIVIVRVPGGAELGSIPAPAALDVSDLQPTWSPDGTRIAFSRQAWTKPVSQVTPGDVDRPSTPGGSVSVEQVIPTDKIQADPDVVLLVDTTLSMSGVLTSIRDTLRQSVVAPILAQHPNARFAVAGYKSNVDANRTFSFKVFTDLTTASTDLTQPDNLTAPLQALVDSRGGGSGLKAGWINGLYQVSTGNAITYREKSSRIVVLVGDASGEDPSAGHTLAQAATGLKDLGIQVVAVQVTGSMAADGLNGTGQIDTLLSTVPGRLLSVTSPTDVVTQIGQGIHDLPVTVTPKATCGTGLTMSFSPPGPITVPGGTPVRVLQTATVAASAAPGDTLTCTILYQVSPAQGATELQVSVVVHVGTPGVPVVTVDDMVVNTAGPDGTIVNYPVTAVDSAGRALTPACSPVPGSLFPVGQTPVVCTATDSAGRIGQDTATITVVDPATDGAEHIWVAALSFPAAGLPTAKITADLQTDISTRVGTGCQAGISDQGPAWSPDGNTIAFAADRELCLTDPNGRNGRTLVSRAGTFSEVDDPAWSPDGKVIAFSLSDDSESGVNRRIRIIPATGGDSTVVIDTDFDAFQPAFQALSSGIRLTASAAPQPAYVGTGTVQVTFTATNTARQQATRVWIATDVPFQPVGATLLGTLAPGASASVTVAVTASFALRGVAKGTVTAQFPEDVPATAHAETPIVVILPTLTLNPPIGPPGFVTLAIGTDFPPGMTITLAWDRGIPVRTKAVVGADGRFTAQVLVFHHDMLGPRRLSASGPGLTPVFADFLVVPAQQQPKDFVERR